MDERRGLLRRVADFAAPSANPSAVVYGAVTMAAVLAAESGSGDTYLDIFGSALIVLWLYWVAHAYATVVGRHLSTDEPFTPRTFFAAFAHDLGLLRGGAIPLAALAVAWATGASRQTAIDVALYTVVASLVAFELVHGIVWRQTPGVLAQNVGIGVVLGLSVLALHLLLH